MPKSNIIKLFERFNKEHKEIKSWYNELPAGEKVKYTDAMSIYDEMITFFKPTLIDGVVTSYLAGNDEAKVLLKEKVTLFDFVSIRLSEGGGALYSANKLMGQYIPDYEY